MPVVLLSAVLGNDLSFEQGVEFLDGEELIAEPAGERFDVGVLPG